MAEEAIAGQATDPLTPDYTVAVVVLGDRLVFRTHRTSTGTGGEREVPLAAAPWIVETIEMGFWRSPAEGGFPADVHVATREIAGEILELRRGWGIGGPGEPGVTLTNQSRKSALGLPQELQFSDELLINGGLINVLKNLR